MNTGAGILLTAAVCCHMAYGKAVSMDIHLPVTGPAGAAAVAANALLVSKLGEGIIDLAKLDKPHVTLYLTEWECIPSSTPFETCLTNIEAAVTDVLAKIAAEPPCPVTLSAPYAATTYAMMNVSLTPCLQRYSDLIVNATYKFSRPNQTAPSWVHGLPEPERTQKIQMIAKYGSPNVFSQFQPHVSIGWSSNTAAVAAAVGALKLVWNSTTFVPDQLALGTVGAHGTVLRGKDYKDFVIKAALMGCWEDFNCHDGQFCNRNEDPEVEGVCGAEKHQTAWEVQRDALVNNTCPADTSKCGCLLNVGGTTCLNLLGNCHGAFMNTSSCRFCMPNSQGDCCCCPTPATGCWEDYNCHDGQFCNRNEDPEVEGVCGAEEHQTAWEGLRSMTH